MEEEIIDLKDNFIAIRRHLFSIFTFTILATIFTAIALQFVENIYRSDTTIFIETKESNIVSIEGMYQVDMSENEYFNTQMSILRTRNLAEQVYEQLNLNDHLAFNNEKTKKESILLKAEAFLPEFLKEVIHQYIKEDETLRTENPLMKKQRIILKLLTDSTVSQVAKSNLIRFSYKSPYIDLVSLVPNKFAQLYIQGGLSLKSKDNQHALNQLSKRVIGLKETLFQSEQKLNTYRNQNNIIDLNGVTTLETQNIEVITKELLLARKERSNIEIIYSQIKEITNPTIAKYESIPWLMDNQSIRNAQKDTAKMLSILTDLS